MSKPLRTDSWAKGANNLDRPERLPEGFVRSLTNLDPSPGGQLDLRTGYELIAAGNVRMAVAMPDRVVYVEDAALCCYSRSNDSKQVIGSLSPLGEVAGVELNGQVYLASAVDSLRTNGEWVAPWAVPAPHFGVEVIDGPLPAGIYKIGVTAFGSQGEESGTNPIIVRLTEGKALRIVSADARPMRAYVTPANGATLYSQGPLIAGAMAITRVADDAERLTTGGLEPMPACSSLAAFNSLILGIYDNCVLMTSPMYPHLFDPVAGYFPFPAEPTLMAPTDGGVYVVAGEQTFFLTGLESPAPSMRCVLEIGAVPGSAVMLPDGRAAWFTRYGLAIGSAAGEITLPNRQTYAPDTAARGASGVIEHRGNAMVITTMRGVTTPNNLATGDFADLET